MHKWADIKNRSFFPRLWRRTKMQGRRIRSKTAKILVERLTRWLIGPDLLALKTTHGALLRQLSQHAGERGDAEGALQTLDRIIRERETAEHDVRNQTEMILSQQETIAFLTNRALDKLTTEVSAFADKLEAKARPTSWERLDDDDL